MSALVSIITITYNAEHFLERTILSIKNQTLHDFEYILIDGGSKDATLKIAQKYQNLFSIIVSEPDKGLYDAMNKGLAKATGKFVWFMNAGDEIAEIDAIEKIASLQNSDVIFGETLIVDDQGKYLGTRSEKSAHKLPKELIWQDFKKGMLVSHQAFIARREIAPKYVLNNLSADIDWEINCLKKANKVENFDGILAKYLEGGISHQNLIRSLKDRYLILRKHFGFWPNIKNHLWILLRADYLNIFRLLKYIK